MDPGTFPFVIGCFFFGAGALVTLSLVQYLWQRTRWSGRTMGSVVAIDTVSADEAPRSIASVADGVADDAAASRRFYRPVVAYSVDGQQYQVKGSYATRDSTTTTTSVGGTTRSEIRIDPLPYDTGRSMKVGYDRVDPGNAIVIDVRRDLMLFALQSFFGMMFMIIGLLAFYWNGNLAWLGPDWHH
jgi:Protein of unknown function (DUF3592)